MPIMLALAMTLTLPQALPSAPPPASAHALSVTVLSTNLADVAGIGEWGFAAVVEVDRRRWLFDTGARPETVLRNAEDLRIDLSGIEDVILSHHHADHTGGLVTLRKALMAKNPAALSRAHVATGIFLPRRSARPGEANPMIATRRAYEEIGGTFVEHDGRGELQPGVWLTGPVPRTFPERNWSASLRIVGVSGEADDTLPEDQALVIRTARGLTVITGCGHAGVANILAYARVMQPKATVRAVIGGLHLLAATEEQLVWTGARMREAGVAHLLGAHCTGVESLYRLRYLAGLSRATAVVGAVGSGYEDSEGLRPAMLAR